MEQAARDARLAEAEATLLDEAPMDPSPPQLTRADTLTAEGATDAMRSEGVLLLGEILPAAATRRLREHLEAELAGADAALAAGTPEAARRFSPIASRVHRRDLPLTLTPVVASALKAMVTSLAPALEALLGDDPELFELAAIAADDGAPPQPIHADLRPTGWLQSANASTDIDDAMAAAAVPSASVYVAVQDVLDPKMGPTLFLPRTHTAEAHTALYGEGGDADGSGAASGGAGGGARASLLRQSRRVLGLVPAGGGALFDQRLLHAGTANSAGGPRRTLLCVSFMRRELSGLGPTGSLRPEYRAAYGVRDLLMGVPLATAEPPLKAEL